MFLQIHTIISYSASLLNRDDAGLAKRIPFGNATRLRISSQCLKRHWRECIVPQVPEIPKSLRTRSFFTRAVLPRAIVAGVDEGLATELVAILAEAVIKGGVDDRGDLSQPVLFGSVEADYLAKVLQDASAEETPAKALTDFLKSKEAKTNFDAMSKSAVGLTASLFGRMVTSDLLSRVDAPVHVAHGFTVHPANTELDYFTVVDDLNREDETGAAHANQMELGAGVFYGYVVIDIPLLVSNLTGSKIRDWASQDQSVVRTVLERLIDAILRQSPGAKLGSTAPYAHADFVLLETGRIQPRALANAFLEAIPVKGVQTDLRGVAVDRLANYLGRLDSMYGADPTGSRHLSTVFDSPTGLPVKEPVAQAVQAALDAIWNTGTAEG